MSPEKQAYGFPQTINPHEHISLVSRHLCLMAMALACEFWALRPCLSQPLPSYPTGPGSLGGLQSGVGN